MCIVLSHQFVVICYSSNKKLINRVTPGGNTEPHSCPQSLILEGPAAPGGDGKLCCLGQGRETSSAAGSGDQGFCSAGQQAGLWPVALWVPFSVWAFLAPSFAQLRLHQAGLSLESGLDF